MSQKIKTSVEIDGSLSASQIANATTDTDKFLVSDGGVIKYRTGAELATDLGISAGTTSKVQHQVKAGVAINKGQAVYVTGADGTNMIVGLASNATEATSSKTMGLLNATVNINDFADVITEGLLDGLDTSSAVAGNPVWLGTGGNLIYGLANKPYAPSHLVFIGIVTRVNANNGEIFVKVQNGFELNEIHDVDLKTTIPVNGEILGFNGTLWVNKTIAGWLGYTPQAQLNGTGFVKASGTTITYDNTSYYPASNPAGYISTYTETDTLASVTARGASTSTLSTFDGGLNIGNAKLRWGGTTSPTLGFPFTGGPNAFWIDVNDGDTGGLAIDNDGTTIYGAGDSGHVFRVIDEDVYQATSNVDASTTFRIQQGQNGGGYVRGNFEITGTLSASGYNKTNWDTAYGWGNHASAGYITQSTGDSRYLMGTTSPANVNNFTISIGNNGSYSYVQSHSSQPLELNPLGNDVRITGNTALHAGNYSSYAVPLSRTITINGTSYDLSANRSWTVTASETDTLATVVSRGNTANTSIAVRNSISINKSDGSSGGQLAYDSSINQLYLWNSLSSGYFSVYTNNAERLNISSGGAVTANVDMRAPIFYDSNNTAYYLNPNGQSIFGGGDQYVLSLQHSAAQGDFVDALFVQNSESGGRVQIGMSANGSDGQHHRASLRAYKGSGYLEGTFGIALRQSNTTHVQRLTLTSPGDLTVDSSMRAPIFYDSNDTAYYINPADADVSAVLKGTVTIGGGTGGNYDEGLRIIDSGGFSVIAFGASGNSGPGRFNILKNSSDAFEVRNASGGQIWWTNQSGNTVFNTDVRSPIFYDYNNTAYYGDFASTSRINTIQLDTLRGPQGDWLLGYTSGTTYSFGSTAVSDTLNIDFNSTNFANGSTWFGGYGPGSGPGLSFENQNTFARIVFWGLDFYDWNNGTQMVINDGYVLANNSMRSPIFYDSNNTGYYVDPASTSNLNAVIFTTTPNVIAGHGDTSIRLTATGLGSGQQSSMQMWVSEPGVTWNDGGIGFNVTNDNGSPNGFGRINTSFGQAYFRFTTSGTTYFYNTNTSGTRYTNMEMYSDNTVYINNYATAGNSLRAPIFYDSNDTSYYIDPTSTSNIRNITVSSLANSTGLTVNHSGSTPAPAAKFNSAGGGTTYGAITATFDSCNYGTAIRVVTGLWSASQGAIQFYSNTTPVGNIQCSTTTTTYSTSSDYRLKENVVPIESPIVRLKELNPCRFNFINEPSKTVDGFIAHEVQEIIPEAVIGVKDELDYDGSPKYQGIDQSKIVPLLTAALQEAIEKINSLEQRIIALENN